jgi:hypothetical protein
MLQHAEPDTNVVLITNTPELVDITTVPCKLTVVDIETLRDDIDRINEPLFKSIDEEEYLNLISNAYRADNSDIVPNEGYRFPMGIMRHALLWCYQNNVTEFVVTDIGCFIQHDYKDALERLYNHVLVNHPNVIMAHWNYILPEDEFNVLHKRYVPQIGNLIKNHNIELMEESPTYGFIDAEGGVIPANGPLEPDGFLFGTVVSDKENILTFYNLWNDFVRLNYQHKLEHFLTSSWIISFESTLGIVCELLVKYKNFTPTTYFDVVFHSYRPDLSNFATNYRYPNEKFIQHDSRSEFLRLNKEYLIWWYGLYKLRIFGLDKELNCEGMTDEQFEENYQNIKSRYNI